MLSRPPAIAAGLVLPVFLFVQGGGPVRAAQDVTTVAVFPVDNLAGVGVPVDAIREALAGRLAAEGVRVLAHDVLEDFLRRHRVRYTAGVDSATAAALREEVGVEGVVLTSVELSSETPPPKVALTARFVTIRAAPLVAWGDDVGLAGDDAPGLFGTGMINDHGRLLTRAIHRLSDSLVRFLETGEPARPLRASRFRPKAFYSAQAVEAGMSHSIAVLPFHNASPRRNAGEILALHFARHLSSFPHLRVVEIGVVREQLLSARIIMDAGPSISDAEAVAALLEADLVLGGRVLVYEDYEGPEGTPRVEFSTVLIERKSRRVVWTSDSYNDGRDGVRFFERGRSRTAHAMATQMVRLTAERIAGADH